MNDLDADVYIADDGTRHILREVSRRFVYCSFRTCWPEVCEQCMVIQTCDHCGREWCPEHWSSVAVSCTWCPNILCTYCMKECAQCKRLSCGSQIKYVECRHCYRTWCDDCQPQLVLGDSKCAGCVATKCTRCGNCACRNICGEIIRDEDNPLCDACSKLPALSGAAV